MRKRCCPNTLQNHCKCEDVGQFLDTKEVKSYNFMLERSVQRL